MKEQPLPTKRTLDDCSIIVSLLQQHRQPLSFTDFKKTFKEPINNKLITTALNLLIDEQLVEKKLVDGKIRYVFSNETFVSMLTYLQTSTFISPSLESELPFLPEITDEEAERVLLVMVSEQYIRYFLKNELAKIEHTRPTYHIILSLIQKRILQLLVVSQKNQDTDSIKRLIERLKLISHIDKFDIIRSKKRQSAILLNKKTSKKT